MTDRTDSELIEAFLGGDAEALAPLVEKYRRPLYSFILRMAPADVDADDIFQETWTRAVRNLPRFRCDNLLGWLFRIARNLLIDHARRAGRAVSLQASDRQGEEDASTLESRLPASGLSPAEEAGGRQLGERIDRAVETLPPQQREVFLLRMYGGLAFKEIARIQHCSINTCLARMQYALAKLRSLLREEFEELRKES